MAYNRRLLWITICSIVFACLQSSIESKSVTYDGIGTFSENDFYDILHRPIVFLPNSPESINPTFLLYTRQTKHDPDLLIWRNVPKLRDSQFDGSKRTKIIIHGFFIRPKAFSWMKTMKDHLLEIGDFNVIVVDWSNANAPPYNKAIANTRVLGPMIAILIQDLCRIENTTPDRFHIIGHSLGAHAAGAAGKYLQGKLGRITGLDPAGPSYEGLPPDARLWHTDAWFVEAIHTDAKALFPFLGLGMYETCGHVDFYPNGGRDQTGCDKSESTDNIISDLIEGFRRIAICNHVRAIDIYLASLQYRKSLQPKGFLCKDYQQYIDGRCRECGQYGEKCAIFGLRTIEYRRFVKKDLLTEGVGNRFFFDTGPEYPFFLYKYIITIKLSSKKKYELRGKVHLKLIDEFGRSKSFDFSKEVMIFRSGQHYFNTVIFENGSIGKLSRIEFRWTHGLNVVRTKMYVDQIQLVSMFVQFKNKVNSIEQFCNPRVGDGILNSKPYNFVQRC